MLTLFSKYTTALIFQKFCQVQLATELHKISACAQLANTQVAMLREEMEAMRQDTERQQQAMKDAYDSKMKSLEEQHQALAEQAGSIFQSFEYQGADELLSNILGPAQEKASASAFACVSPDSIDVSPDRWSCASTEEGQRRRTSPPEHALASHTHNVKHAAHTKAQTKGDSSGSSGRVLTSSSSSYSSSPPTRLSAVVTRTGAVASV